VRGAIASVSPIVRCIIKCDPSIVGLIYFGSGADTISLVTHLDVLLPLVRATLFEKTTARSDGSVV